MHPCRRKAPRTSRIAHDTLYPAHHGLIARCLAPILVILSRATRPDVRISEGARKRLRRCVCTCLPPRGRRKTICTNIFPPSASCLGRDPSARLSWLARDDKKGGIFASKNIKFRARLIFAKGAARGRASLDEEGPFSVREAYSIRRGPRTGLKNTHTIKMKSARISIQKPAFSQVFAREKAVIFVCTQINKPVCF